MKRLSILVAAAFAVVLMADTASAQTKGAIEIGTDATFGYSITGTFNDVDVADIISVGIPGASWRFGFWLNETWSIEPEIGLSYLKFTDDGPSLTTFDVSAAVLYNLPSGLFFAVAPTLSLANLDPGGDSDSSTTTVFGVGGGIGYRLPLADMLKLRLLAAYAYTFENENDFVPSASNIVGAIGFSFFTK